MGEERIVTELFLEKPSFKDVSKVAHVLEEIGVKSILMPPEDREINTHLVVENSDLDNVRKKLKSMNIKAIEKEVIIIRLENKPGTMADAAKKISDKGVNLLYAFSVAMTPTMSYVLLGTSDNKTALNALK